jgi:glycosyltransferase involved in cell wall biosynthesis
MGAYAAWLSGLLVEGGATCFPPAADRDVLPVLLVSDFEPNVDSLYAHLGGIPQVIVLPGTPAERLPGVRYYSYRTATNPIEWDADVETAIQEGIRTVAFFLAPEELRGRTCLHLYRRGAREIVTIHGGKVRSAHALTVALAKKAHSLRERWCGNRRVSSARCRQTLASLQPDVGRRRNGTLRIGHFVNSLDSGGAERQACCTAVGQHTHGHDVRLLLRQAPVGRDAHYRHLLDPEGIQVERIGARWRRDFVAGWRRRGLSSGWFHSLPADLRTTVMDLAGELLARPVDVLHCYVDDCCVPGVLAASLAGTPGVVLSLRNGNPSHFPGLLRPWMREWYRWAWGREGVAFVANSAAGARDYETWLGVPRGSVPVIRNAFPPAPLPAPERVERWRREHGVAPGQPVLAGVFRLEPEKRPLYFLECVERLRRFVPGLRVFMAGVGSLEACVRRVIERKRLAPCVQLLGQRADVPLLLAASDILLLVSDWEGTPNVVLEAQHYGSVPVATEAGGTGEALLADKTGVLVGVDDMEGTVRAAAALLHDEPRRKMLSRAGRGFVRERFSPEALYRNTVDLYESTLGRATARSLAHA